MPRSAVDVRREYHLRKRLGLCPRCKTEVNGLFVFCTECRLKWKSATRKLRAIIRVNNPDS